MKELELTVDDLSLCKQRWTSLEPILTKDNLFLIKQFAISINFTQIKKIHMLSLEEPMVFDRLFELSYIFKRNMENYEDDGTDVISKNNIKKILTDTDLRDIIQLFNTHKDAEIALDILDYTYKQLENYSSGCKLDKNDFEGITAHDLSIAVKLRDKNTHQGAIEAYKEAYKLLFATNKIIKHGNVVKLRELVNKIFSITLKDKDIKQTPNSWWIN